MIAGAREENWVVNKSHRQTVVNGRMLLSWLRKIKSLGKSCLMIICINYTGIDPR